MIAMPEHTTTGSAPFSIRLTPEERQALENRAGRQALGAYIRARLFEDQGEEQSPRRTARRPAIKDDKALAQVLALLGQSHLAGNVNQLARAANSGSLPMTPEVRAALTDASADIADMKAALMQALDIRER
ncbi:plasmid mobilization relaxosome protein MobC [Roseospira goensis]|jgi:hypothetical protein|uniref:MobC family plasmid mobilization relaxosome protein n=1 Tax=Roseospira goensis TaxID=391922 RepID=A0A7W6S0L6_9PROT|nr:plasmid mobilization relaxosome protein MobC [Roseospira goensis]MBB4286074.1 hypothetical protein [Roseospira goensis]